MCQRVECVLGIGSSKCFFHIYYKTEQKNLARQFHIKVGLSPKHTVSSCFRDNQTLSVTAQLHAVGKGQVAMDDGCCPGDWVVTNEAPVVTVAQDGVKGVEVIKASRRVWEVVPEISTRRGDIRKLFSFRLISHCLAPIASRNILSLVNKMCNSSCRPFMCAQARGAHTAVCASPERAGDWSKYYDKHQKLLEIEKQIMREVALRVLTPHEKSADQKAQIIPVSGTNAFLICAFWSEDFLRWCYSPSATSRTISFFYFQ